MARESIFSDLNNLEVVTTSSDKYETAFGFTQEEVDAAHAQIEEKRYAAELVASGVPRENVREYGFAFEGKRALIG